MNIEILKTQKNSYTARERVERLIAENPEANFNNVELLYVKYPSEYVKKNGGIKLTQTNVSNFFSRGWILL